MLLAIRRVREIWNSPVTKTYGRKDLRQGPTPISRWDTDGTYLQSACLRLGFAREVSPGTSTHDQKVMRATKTGALFACVVAEDANWPFVAKIAGKSNEYKNNAFVMILFA